MARTGGPLLRQRELLWDHPGWRDQSNGHGLQDYPGRHAHDATHCSESGCADAQELIEGLVQATDGDFYGTTTFGRAHGDGTVFSLSVDLGPFMETLPTSGKVGAAIKILGTNLTGASNANFNGTPAIVGVSSNSQTEIATIVPSGATTGPVEVATPNRTLSSNAPFRVLPSLSEHSLNCHYRPGAAPTYAGTGAIVKE